MSRAPSTKPVREKAPEWVPMRASEVEAKIVEMAKDGVQPAQIGLRLRDNYGIPSVHELTGKKITAILAENEATGKLPQDLQNLVRRSINLQEHLQHNSRDIHNRRGLELIEARIRKLAKYYQKKGALETTWKYTRQGARLLVD